MEGPLQFFLDRYQNLSIPNESIRKAFVEAVLEVLGVSVELGDVSFKKGTIYLSSNPYIKGEVSLHKNEITSILESKVGKKPQQII